MAAYSTKIGLILSSRDNPVSAIELNNLMGEYIGILLAIEPEELSLKTLQKIHKIDGQRVRKSILIDKLRQKISNIHVTIYEEETLKMHLKKFYPRGVHKIVQFALAHPDMLTFMRLPYNETNVELLRKLCKTCGIEKCEGTKDQLINALSNCSSHIPEKSQQMNILDEYLHTAVLNEDITLAEEVLEKGADPNKVINANLREIIDGKYYYTRQGVKRQSLLNIAIESLNLEMVILLLEYNAKQNYQSSYIDTPLNHVFRYYFQNNKDLQDSESLDKINKIVKILVNYGADVNIPEIGNNHDYPLHHTIKYNRYTRQKLPFEILFKNKANINVKNDHGESPLYYSIEYYTKGSQIPDNLINSGAVVDGIDPPLDSILFVSLNVPKYDVNESDELTEYLIDKGANPDQIDHSGTSFINKVARSGRNYILEILIELDIDLNDEDDNGVTPIYSAILGNKLDTVKLLVENGADINYIDEKGNTYLHVAARFNKKAIAEYLLNKGINHLIANFDGKIAYYLVPTSKRAGYDFLAPPLTKKAN